MLILIASFTFATVALLILGLTMRSEREMVRERMLKQVDSTRGGSNSAEVEMSLPLKDRIILPVLRKLADKAARLTPTGAVQIVESKLDSAGGVMGLGGREFMGLRVLSAGVFPLVAIMVAGLLDTAALPKMIIFICIFCGALLPDYLLQRAIQNRSMAIRRVLPDTLDLLTVSVEAGLGLDGAMQKVVEKMHNPLSAEMERALKEMQIGKLRSEALRNLAKRANVQELSSFVAAICHAEQLGVSIGQVLRVQSEVIRNARAQRAREVAAKLPVKMLFPLVLFIFPSLFVVILAPGVIQTGKALGILQ